MTIENNEEIKINKLNADASLFENDPINKLTHEKYSKIIEKTEPLFNKLTNIITECINSKEYSISEIILTLSRCSNVATQPLCANYEEFIQHLEKANKLVVENILPALGSNANSEVNKSALVTYNGEYNQENFSIKRLFQLANSIVEYVVWKTTFNESFYELTHEKEENDSNE